MNEPQRLDLIRKNVLKNAIMKILGFDKTYYLNAKLAALQAISSDWSFRDTAFLETYIASHGMTPEEHYIQYGWAEGLSPNAFFNPGEYRTAKAHQLADTGYSPTPEAGLKAFDSAWPWNVYLHYIQFGAAEGINPSNQFDETRYLTDKLTALRSDPATTEDWALKAITDLRGLLTDLGMTVVDHYLLYGAAEGLQPVPVPEQNQAKAMPHPHVTLPPALTLDWVDTVEITTLPHTAIGQIRIRFDDQINLATGFLISPEHVLTSAHVLLDSDGRLDETVQISFFPGLSGDAATAVSYGWQQAWVQTRVHATELSPRWPDNDLGLIKLDQTVSGITGYLTLADSLTLKPAGTPVSSAGYSAHNILQDNPETPGPDYYQWSVSGTIDRYLFDNSALGLSESMAVTPGASGSPVYYMEDGTAYVSGILAGTLGSDTVAAAMDQDSREWLVGILQQDGYYI
jgi:V8-like Glu-specific endopeptidase